MATKPEKPVEVFTFNYTKYRTKHITLTQLDQLMEFVVAGGTTSTWGTIVAGLKLLMVFAYLWAHKALVEEQMLIEKHEYELNRTNANQDQANQPEPVLK